MLTILIVAVVQAPQTSVFADDSRLNAVHEFRCEAETVGEFLESVSKRLEIRFQGSADVRYDALILYSKAPVRETLERIATHFDWTWEKDRDGYILKQTSAQKSAETRSREDQIVAPYAVWQSNARKALASFRVGDSTIRQKLENVLEEQGKLRESYETEYSSGNKLQRDAWVQKSRENDIQINELSHLLSPTWRLVDTIVAQLTRAELLELDRSTKLVFGAPATNWQNRMSPEGVQSAGALASTWANYQIEAATAIEQELQSQLKLPHRMGASRDLAQGVRATVRIDLNRPQATDTFLRAPIAISMLDRQGVEIGRSTVYPVSLDQLVPTAKRTPREKGPLDEKLITTDDLKAALETDEAGNLKRSITAADFLKSDKRQHPVQPIARILIEVAKATDKNLISDVYDSLLYWARRPLPVQSAGAALDVAAAANGQKWKLEENWVALRAENWQLKRFSTVNPPLLYRIRDAMKSAPESLDSFAWVVSQLADRQLETRNIGSTMLAKWSEYFHPSHRATLWAIRFWGSLQPVVRTRILAGDRLVYGSLTSRQQDCVRMFVFLSDKENYTSEFISQNRIKFGLEGDDYEWKKRSWPGYPEDAIHRDAEPTAQLPNGIPFDAQIGMRQCVVNALVVSSSGGWKRPMSEGEAIEGGIFSPRGSEVYTAAPTTQNRYAFTVWCTPTLAKGVQLRIFDPPKGDPKPFSELPKEIVDRLEKAQRLRTGG